MPRFFFHIDYGEHSQDREGTVLSDVWAARRSAVSLLGELLCDQGDRFWEKPNITITVEDSSEVVLWTVEAMGTASSRARAHEA